MKVVPLDQRQPMIVHEEEVPIIYGLSDVAEALHIKKQSVYQNLNRQLKGLKVDRPIPLPYTVISSGPLWTKKQIDLYLLKYPLDISKIDEEDDIL